jgi:NTF2 fold immunity protein
MTKAFSAFLVFLLLVLCSYGRADKSPLPAQGIIPDEVTAVKVAEAVFTPIFGAEEVAKYSPYHARLAKGLWTVYGTLKPGSRGGTPQMTIQKNDGKVIEVWHSQ